MDDTTTLVADLYRKYPYPRGRGDAGDAPLSELANLLKFFVLESKRDLNGLRVLDAGTGTGHRLIEAARAFPQTTFEGIDAVSESLDIAATAAVEAGVPNVSFLPGDLMNPVSLPGTFDIVLCMGVLHHLSDPQRGLANLLACLDDSGVMFLYVYGALGARERMRRKRLIAELTGTSHGDFGQGITLARALGFDDMDFGWTHGPGDGPVPDSLLVDAYLNVHERLYDASSIHSLIGASVRDHSYILYGVTRRDQGLLFDTRLEGRMQCRHQKPMYGRRWRTTWPARYMRVCPQPRATGCSTSCSNQTDTPSWCARE